MLSTIEKPCIRQCCLDDNDVCVGCFRTFDDMRLWHKASIEEKEKMLKDAQKRKQEHARKLT